MALAAAIEADGYDVVVVAPSDDRSGASASLRRIVPSHRIKVRPVSMTAGGRRIEARSLDAPPALIAMAGVLGAFADPPDVVASGVDLGPNTGHSILHSGTVGAALTAQNFGASGLAVSVAGGPRWRTETAGEIAVDVLRWLADAPAGPHSTSTSPPGRPAKCCRCAGRRSTSSGRCGRPPSPWPAGCSSNFGTPAPTSTRAVVDRPEAIIARATRPAAKATSPVG